MQRSKIDILLKNIPTNKQEGTLFTLLMCSMMVFVMTGYNMWMHGESVTLGSWIIGFLPGFFVALILDVFIIGKVAPKIAFSLPNKTNIPMAFKISCLMVLGMASCMSLFGIIMNNSVSWSAYSTAWSRNIIVALPLQLILVGPISRMILGMYQAKTATAE